MRGINFRLIFRIISRTFIIFSISIFLCSLVGFYYKESVSPFIYSGLITLVIGVVLHHLTKQRDKNNNLNKKEAYLTVGSTWILICIAGTLPYIFSETIPYFINALFESVSGFTTTGSSILTDIEALPKSILFWRSLTHWIGGLGIIALFLLIMPSFKMGTYHLFTLESSLQEKIQPRIRSVGIRIMIIYITLTIVEIILLLIGNMNLFESVCHAFGTIATGGFSPKNTSIGGYSPYIQYVIMVFMFLSGTNFIIYYYLISRDFTKIKMNSEVKFYVSIVLGIALLITFVLYFNMGKPLETAFRESFFNVISILTCTGYATADYLQWPAFAWILIFFTMFFGGSTGSTAGGIKMARHVVFWKNIKNIFRQLVHPHAVLTVNLNGNLVKEESNRSILTFIALYMLVFAIGTIVLSFIGLDIQTAAGSAATSMAGIGPGIGTVGPASNFAHLPEAAKLVLSFLMITGRLEIYTILILFTRTFWKF
ncbi:MAG: TrkH family potassium uptake protein [Bacteroidota bacterium]|nr:TrkH family potassium uptake protein [Bacteroidota bacterium]